MLLLILINIVSYQNPLKLILEIINQTNGTTLSKMLKLLKKVVIKLCYLVHVIYGIPITTLIFRNYYAEIPDELLEAGKIDGAGFWGLYRFVLFPLSVPGFVVVIIWEFQSIWNEFLFAVVLTNNAASQPITVALNNLAGSYIVEWNVQMAGALLAALPTLLIFIILGRYFMRGLLAGSLKG
jgi:glucose/mannose transport system permease protein